MASMLSAALLTLIFMCVHNKVRIFFIDCVSVEGVYCKMSQSLDGVKRCLRHLSKTRKC